MVVHKRRFRKRKGSFSSAFLNIFLGALALVIIGFLVEANFKINRKRNQLQEQFNSLQEKVQELEVQKAEYEQGILRAQTNEFWEEKLVEQGYKKPGEGVFVIVPPEESQQEQVEQEKSFWQKLLQKLEFLRD